MFFVASRGHHADIGGITPGSMPPHSKTIFEEGAVFKSFFLVKNNHFQEEGRLSRFSCNLLVQFVTDVLLWCDSSTASFVVMRVFQR